LFRVITGLDPTFEQAYIFGALVLAEDAGDIDAALGLLTIGMAALPDSWWLAFERGFLRWIHLDEPEVAAKDFHRASLLPGAPPWMSRFAAWAYERTGRKLVAVGLWEQIVKETDNPMVREIAERALKRLEEAESEGKVWE
jgi:hypothetical protein